MLLPEFTDQVDSALRDFVGVVTSGAGATKPEAVIAVVDVGRIDKLTAIFCDFRQPGLPGVFSDFVSFGFFERRCHLINWLVGWLVGPLTGDGERLPHAAGPCHDLFFNLIIYFHFYIMGNFSRLVNQAQTLLCLRIALGRAGPLSRYILRTVRKHDHYVEINRKRLQLLRREIGHEAIWCKPRTRIPDKGHRK